MSLKEDFAAQGMTAGNHFAVAMGARSTAQASMEVHVYPDGEFYCERGLMRGRNTRIDMSTRIGDQGSWLSRVTLGLIRRKFAGEDALVAQFNNKSGAVAAVEVTPESYSGLAAINLEEIEGHTLHCRRGSWVLSGPDNSASFEFFRNAFSPSSWTGLKPFAMEKITGQDIVVIGSQNSGLRVIDLPAGESYIADRQDLLGYTRKPSVGVTSWNPSILFSKERFLNPTFDGPCKLVLRTQPS
ncbi:MAG: Mitochondrial biosis [Micavibrio sp.]|nr:Mitochondrial biosis [Micavibrio sp.]